RDDRADHRATTTTRSPGRPGFPHCSRSCGGWPVARPRPRWTAPTTGRRPPSALPDPRQVTTSVRPPALEVPAPQSGTAGSGSDLTSHTPTGDGLGHAPRPRSRVASPAQNPSTSASRGIFVMSEHSVHDRSPVPVEELVACAQRGQSWAWQAIIERYRPLIHAVARGYRLNHHDAEDVSQTVW